MTHMQHTPRRMERKDAGDRNQPSVGEIKTAIEGLAKTFEEFKAVNDRELAEIKKGGADVVTTDEVAKINDEVTRLSQTLRDLQAKGNRPGLGGGDPDVDQAKAEHKTAFESWFRKGRGEGDLREIEQKAFSTQSDPDGGFLLPEQMEGTIDRVLGTVSVMRNISTVLSIGAPTYKKLVNVGGASSGWVGETESRPETNTPTLRELVFNAMELYANPASTQTALDDAAMDLAAWLANEVNIEFAEQEGEAFISGTGVNQPRGLLSYSAVANSSYSWGSLGYVASGAAGAFAASDPSDKLIDLVHALKTGYRTGARWLMNDLTTATVRKFKDADGNYLWKPGITEGQSDTLLGKPISYDDNMPDIAADSLSIAFGDFRRGYLIVDRQGVRVLRDPFTNKPYVHFYTTKRVGGGIQNFEAVKLMKFSA
jgi:HK97 family phage major capsid protein